MYLVPNSDHTQTNPTLPNPAQSTPTKQNQPSSTQLNQT